MSLAQQFLVDLADAGLGYLDNILSPVSDLEVTCGIDIGDITSMQIAASPEMLRVMIIFQMALGQPGGSQDYFPAAFPISRSFKKLSSRQRFFREGNV